MSILVYAEHSDGKLKKPAFEAATYAADLGKAFGLDVVAVVVGNVSADEIQHLGKYGVSRAIAVTGAGLEQFVEAAYAGAVAAAAKQTGASIVVLPQTYGTRAIGPRLSVKLGMGYLSGMSTLAAKTGNGIEAKRIANSGKSIETQAAKGDKAIISVKSNGYGVKESGGGSVAIESLSYAPSAKELAAKPVKLIKASDKISLTEADVVVSAGRGMGGPDKWGKIDELAELLGAATACSKPVADIHWRPHHEHVGQTGIQIAPNFYFAFGISGAIQHLAGVNQSKTILVINKDPEAPFFKAADYGIVGDVHEVLPPLVEAVRKYKGK